MRGLFLIIYYLIISKLPRSSFPFGKFFNLLRIAVLSRIIRVGKNCYFQDHIYIGNGKDIEIGDHCHINEYVKLDNVKIGNYVMIARYVTFLGKIHETSAINIPMLMQGQKPVQQTIVEDDVWIGTNAIILPGLHLRKGTIIGAGAVVTKNSEPYSVMVGIPAKIVRYRD